MCKQAYEKERKYLKRMTFKPGLHTHSSTSNQFHSKVIKDTFRTYFLTITFDYRKEFVENQYLYILILF